MSVRRALPLFVCALFCTASACEMPVEHGLTVPIPLKYDNGLLYTYGEGLVTRDLRCGIDPGSSPPEPSPSPLILLELGNPLTVVSDAAGRDAQPFQHGQVQINATTATGLQGPARFLLCDVPLLRGNQALTDFFLERTLPGQAPNTTGPLAAVLGSDMFPLYALTFSFTGPAASPSAQVMIEESYLKDACFVDDAVLPFLPLGGDLKVEVGDSIVTYNPSRITLAACVEPIADPFAYKPSGASVRSCIDMSKHSEKDCTDTLAAGGLVGLGDLVDGYDSSDGVADGPHWRDPAYERSGVPMRFLLSTAVPDLLLSQTACERLDNGATRCTCDDADKVLLRLPGINGPQPDQDNAVSVEKGCLVKLGQPGRSALALISTELQLAPCDELARSRRQRYALPVVGVPLPVDVPPPSDCMREACLQNLARDSSLTSDRCAFTGMDADIQRACDDHQAPVAAYVELGGPSDDPTLPDDTVEVLVVPDSARILQSANLDLRNTTSQVDGVIGVSLLSRLHTVVDYPESRVELVCRCGLGPAQVCRTYRGTSYHDQDPCYPNLDLTIPADFGRAACR